MSISPTLAEKVWLFTQNSDGTLSPAVLSGGGGSGTPGGTPTQLQFNNTAFAGVPGSSVDPTTGEITLTTVTGIVLNIVQQDVSFEAINVSDGAGDLFQIYTQGGVTAFNLADSSSGTITLQTAFGTPSLSLVDSASSALFISPSSIGFFNATPVAEQTVAGVKLPSDTVMASLLAALAAYGLIIDSTT